MNEKVLRLEMHAFRGVPGEMTVDFGKGESIAVYGDNGTGKSTIADALEWYFTGQIELLTHEGRQHAVRYVGGETNGGTSVEVVTNGTLSGTVVLPDERNLEAFDAIRRETFLLRGRTLADFIWTQSRAFEKIFNGRETSCAEYAKPRRNRSEPTSGP